MSKRPFKSQANSGRASGALGAFGNLAIGTTSSSALSYVQEPVDYTGINDPNVTVALKNLSKRDGTTKAKALEDLQDHFAGESLIVEDSLLEAWASLFPRLSIDNLRRVRQLAQQLNGVICSVCGKRIVKYMPRLVGAWLAGTFDGDRTVARAASDALYQVFPSSEKVGGVKKAFQRSILSYCQDAALHETQQTLSDERNVSADDAAAIYARVIATSLSLIGTLLTDLDFDERAKEQQLYEDIFSNSKLWDFVCYTDATVRRSACRLARTVLQHHKSSIEENLQILSNVFVYKGLHSDQSGSAQDFVATLGIVTKEFPVLWTGAYSAKKPAIARLRHFLKAGSQSTSADYWTALRELLVEIPKQLWPLAESETGELLSAAQVGVSKKEERFNANAAWPCYFALSDLLTRRLSDEDARQILTARLLPIVSQYLYPDAETSAWTVNGARPASTVSGTITVSKFVPIIAEQWSKLAAGLIEAAKMSQPEQSKDFEKSQTHIAGIGERWAGLQREMWKAYRKDSAAIIEPVFVSVNDRILQECIALLKARNGKPFGAAAIIEALNRTCGDRLLANDAFKHRYMDFLLSDVFDFAFTPSLRPVVYSAYHVKDDVALSDVLNSLLRRILVSDHLPAEKLDAFSTIFANGVPQEVLHIARSMPEFQEFLVTRFAVQLPADSSLQIAKMVELGTACLETVDEILSRLTASLSMSNDATLSAALDIADILSQSEQPSVRTLMSSSGEAYQKLLPMLLRLEQSPTDVLADKAAVISARLSSNLGENSSDTKYAILKQALENVSSTALPMSAVYELLDRTIGSEGVRDHAHNLLPDRNVWRASLENVVRPPKHSLALLTPLGGAVHFVTADKNVDSIAAVKYDSDGLSLALRIAMYSTRLFRDYKIADLVGQRLHFVMSLLHLTVLMAEDNISLLDTNELWLSHKGDAHNGILDFIPEAERVLVAFWRTETEAALASIRNEFLEVLELPDNAEAFGSAMSYYTALSRTKALEVLFDTKGCAPAVATEVEALLKQHIHTEDCLTLTAFISGFAQALSGSQVVIRLCNELVSDLTDYDFEMRNFKGIRNLILLNTVLRSRDDAVSSISKQRLIFLVKHLITTLKTNPAVETQAEVCKAIEHLLPTMADMYGEHWTQLVSFIREFWASGKCYGDEGILDEDRVLLLNASLRLFATLKKLAKSDEPNDDLIDALKGDANKLDSGLLRLLTEGGRYNDDTHQPLLITQELLGRQISITSYNDLYSVNDLYPLLYAPSRPVKQAAFDLFHHHIPVVQEQLSLEAALDNKSVQLPDELLSLILEAPTLDSLADASFDRMMPHTLQGYLYSWCLLFDHFDGSSYRVKNDYIEQLKENDSLADLLSLTFDFLGHSRGRPVDASKFDITTYASDVEPSPERDVQWLLAHLYFLALTHLPSLVKSYYLDIRSRQTSQAVETWTARHVSPLIIKTSLEAVAEWSEKSAKEDPEYDKMSVKVGMRSREINVSYLVDEQTMAIRVTLPEAYPLAPAQVLGVSRVAVKEEKWQSWLRNCQGVITFSNGSITDGLSAWRRNVTGALKGQTECAICYSIISADKQLPTKRCPTCKNLFHSSCLFKWFKTSNASTCPLCRNPFNFN